MPTMNYFFTVRNGRAWTFESLAICCYLMLWHSTRAFVPPGPHRSIPQSAPTMVPLIPITSSSPPSPHHNTLVLLVPTMTTTRLNGIVADRPTEMEGEETKKRKRDNNDHHKYKNGDAAASSAWIPSEHGGFLPNLPMTSVRVQHPRGLDASMIADDAFINAAFEKKRDEENVEKSDSLSVATTARDVARTSPSTLSTDFPPHHHHSPSPPPRKTTRNPLRILTVKDIHQYKKVVADEKDQMVVVRFYAPWCRACRAIQTHFRRLPKDFLHVKFVEVPVTKENAFLHQGLGVPSLPFGHIYHPSAGLVEERKISKLHFATFKHVLSQYVNGQCQVEYNEDGSMC